MRLLTLSLKELEVFLIECKGPELEEFLLSFRSSKNEDIQAFFCEKATKRDKEDYLRTFVIIDVEKENKIAGFFSLTITNRIFSSDVSKNQMKRISSKAQKDGMFTATLISKLGKSDDYKNEIDGTLIVEEALKICYEIYKYSGLKHVCVDYYDNEHLEKFYMEDCSFKKYQKDLEKKMNYCFYKFS